MATLSDLPDSVLLEILSLLPVRDRVRNARVCRRWKSLLQDPWMWRHADLPFQELWGRSSWDPDQVQVRLNDFWHDVPCYIGSSLQSLRLQGYRVTSTTILDMSPEFFEALGRKCSHLQRLSLHMADLIFIPVASLPRSLRRLEIHSCDITFFGLPENEAEGVLPHLEQLVLDHLPSFRDHHLQRLRCFPGLRSLVLAGIYDLSETGLNMGLQAVSQSPTEDRGAGLCHLSQQRPAGHQLSPPRSAPYRVDGQRPLWHWPGVPEGDPQSREPQSLGPSGYQRSAHPHHPTALLGPAKGPGVAGPGLGGAGSREDAEGRAAALSGHYWGGSPSDPGLVEVHQQSNIESMLPRESLFPTSDGKQRAWKVLEKQQKSKLFPLSQP